MFLLAAEMITLWRAGSEFLNGQSDMGGIFGAALALLIPLLGIYYFVEFGTFRFNKDDAQFSWTWRGIIRSKSGRLPLDQIKRVRRDALSSSDGGGYHNTYRLIVITNEDKKIPLSRSFSGTQSKQLDDVVDRIRIFLDMPN